MKHNGSLLEPVPAGRRLGQAMTVKLPSDLVAKLMSRPRVSIKLGPTERVLMIGDETFSLEEAKEDKGSHDLYHQYDDSIVRVAAIRSRLNVQRTLNQQVAAEVRERTERAELEYRGKKSMSVDEAPTTAHQAMLLPANRKRAFPTAPSIQKPDTTRQKSVPKPGTSALKLPLPSTAEVRKLLVHALAASDKGLSLAALEKQLSTPSKDFRFVLGLVGTIAAGGDLYKLNNSVYKEVDPNYDGYSPAERAVAMANKQRVNLELAAAAKPPPSKPEKPPPEKKTSPSNAVTETIKKRKPGEVPPESLTLSKPTACPEEIPLSKLKYNEKYAKTLPEITTYQEYENYRKRFFTKHERYKELDQLLLANSKEFTELAHQFERCADRAEKKRLKEVILQRIAQKKQPHQHMVAEWKALHVELTEIKDRVSAYVEEYKKMT